MSTWIDDRDWPVVNGRKVHPDAVAFPYTKYCNELHETPGGGCLYCRPNMATRYGIECEIRRLGNAARLQQRLDSLRVEARAS